MQVSTILRDVSKDLNDQEHGYEYLTWPKEMLRSYLYEALTQLAGVFRKLFLVHKVVRVKPGGLWQKACGCEQIIRVVGEVTENGEQLLRYLTDTTDDTRTVWSGLPVRCPAAMQGNYEMTGYSISNTDESSFRIYPPVPRGEPDHFVMVECFEQPEGAPDDYNVPTRLVALIKEWMLMRAYGLDSENNPAVLQVSQMHEQTYFKLLQMQLAALKAEEEAYGDVRTISNDTSERPA